MTILETSRQFTPEELYALTKNPKNEVLKAHDGESLEVSGYCIYEDTNTKGEVRTLMSLEITDEEFAITSNSETARRSLNDIMEIYRMSGIENPFPFMIEVYHDTARGSKRTFYDIKLKTK